MTPEKYKEENKKILKNANEMLVPGKWVLLCGSKMELLNKEDIPTPSVFDTPEEGLAYIKEHTAEYGYANTRVIKRFDNTPKGHYEMVDYEGYVEREHVIHVWSLMKIEDRNAEDIRIQYRTQARSLLSFWKYIDNL